MDNQPKIEYQYPYFESYLQPNGALLVDRACHACFYYGMLAARSLAAIGESNESQVLLYKVGDTPPDWLEANLGNIAKGVAALYVLESPDDFLRFRREAWAQMSALGVEVPEYVFRVVPGKIVAH